MGTWARLVAVEMEYCARVAAAFGRSVTGLASGREDFCSRGGPAAVSCSSTAPQVSKTRVLGLSSRPPASVSGRRPAAGQRLPRSLLLSLSPDLVSSGLSVRPEKTQTGEGGGALCY